MASKSQRARLRRLKLATETVEDELNRLPPPDARDFEAWELVEAHHTVIRHLKARWGELHAELNGGTDAGR